MCHEKSNGLWILVRYRTVRYTGTVPVPRYGVVRYRYGTVGINICYNQKCAVGIPNEIPGIGIPRYSIGIPTGPRYSRDQGYKGYNNTYNIRTHNVHANLNTGKRVHTEAPIK